MTYHVAWTATDHAASVPKFVREHQEKQRATGSTAGSGSMLDLGPAIKVKFSYHVNPELGKPAGFLVVEAADESVLKAAAAHWPGIHVEILPVLTDSEVAPILAKMAK